MISDSALREFKEIWVAQFGFEIPDNVAMGEAVNMLTMFNVVYRPVKQEWIDEFDNRKTDK